MLSVFPAPDSPLNMNAPADTKTSSFTHFHFRCSEKDQPLPDNAALVTVVSLHVEVAVVSYGKDVGRHFTDLLVSVLADLVSCVDRQQLVWIYCNQYGACICLLRSIDRVHDADEFGSPVRLCARTTGILKTNLDGLNSFHKNERDSLPMTIMLTPSVLLRED